MKKSIIILSLSVAAGVLASCSSINKNDPWSPQHQKARNKVIFPLG